MYYAQIETHNGDCLIFDNLEKDGNQISCDLEVASHGYSCKMRFYFTMFNLDDALKKLEDMYKNLSGECRFETEYDEGNRIELKINKMGHLYISGTLTRHDAQLNQFKFAFQTDQTLLFGFKEQLKRFKTNESES